MSGTNPAGASLGLLGGEELQGLVVVQVDPPQPGGSQIVLSVHRGDPNSHDFAAHEKCYRAHHRIKEALQEKSSDLSRFVSVRIHASGVCYRAVNSDEVVSLSEEITKFKPSPSPDMRVMPNESILIPSLERIDLPEDVYAVLQARTAVSSRGLDVTATNIIVPGFSGFVQLYITNSNPFPVEIPEYFALGELFFFRTHARFSGAGIAYKKDTTDLVHLNTALSTRRSRLRENALTALAFLGGSGCIAGTVLISRNPSWGLSALATYTPYVGGILLIIFLVQLFGVDKIKSAGQIVGSVKKGLEDDEKKEEDEKK